MARRLKEAGDFGLSEGGKPLFSPGSSRTPEQIQAAIVRSRRNLAESSKWIAMDQGRRAALGSVTKPTQAKGLASKAVTGIKDVGSKALAGAKGVGSKILGMVGKLK